MFFSGYEKKHNDGDFLTALEMAQSFGRNVPREVLCNSEAANTFAAIAQAEAACIQAEAAIRQAEALERIADKLDKLTHTTEVHGESIKVVGYMEVN